MNLWQKKIAVHPIANQQALFVMHMELDSSFQTRSVCRRWEGSAGGGESHSLKKSCRRQLARQGMLWRGVLEAAPFLWRIQKQAASTVLSSKACTPCSLR